MLKVVSHWPFTSEARVRASVSPCGNYGGQNYTGTGFPRSSSVFPVNIIPPWFHLHIYLGGWRIGPLVAAVQKRNLAPLTWTAIYFQYYPQHTDGALVQQTVTDNGYYKKLAYLFHVVQLHAKACSSMPIVLFSLFNFPYTWDLNFSQRI
jgi:hypothetical protein